MCKYGVEYVDSITCNPALYGSSNMSELAVPVNLYDEAKKILGSETDEWKELISSGTIQEKTYEAFTYEELTGDEFYAGMTKTLSLKRK